MSSNNFVELLIYYGGGVALLLLLLIVVKVAAKAMVSKRVRGVMSIGMTLEDLERMRRTGLIYDEEYKRAKAKVAERMLESTLPKPSLPAETALQVALSEIDQGAGMAGAEGKTGAGGPAAAALKERGPSDGAAPEPGSAAAAPTPGSPVGADPRPAAKAGKGAEAAPGAPGARRATGSAPEPKGGKRSDAPLPLDLEQLRTSGVIDEGEYERLKDYFARRRR